MAEQEELTADRPVPGGSRTGRAVALARLLHHESSRLLQLYRERERFLLDHTPEGGRLVVLSLDSEEPTVEEQVHLMHSALRQCLGLLHCVILKEVEEFGELDADYETMRKNVRMRLEYLLHSTKVLLDTDETTVEVTPDHQCTEEVDGAMGPFALKMWTYRVLLEVIHWAQHAVQTLHDLHTEREGREEI